MQSELMEMKQEVMDDTMDEVMGDADEEEETYVCVRVFLCLFSTSKVRSISFSFLFF